MHVGARKAHELQRQRGVKGGPGLAQPVVEGIFGPPDGALAAVGQFVGHFIGLVQQVFVFYTQRDQANAFGLFTAEGFAQHQVVFGFGHAAQQRPNDGRVVPCRHAQAGVAIDDLGAFGGDGDVGQQTGHQARAHSWAMHGADDGLVAVDDVVDQVARFAPHPRADLKVLRHVLHQGQVTAARKPQTLATQHHTTHAVVFAHIAPNFRQLLMPSVACGGQFAVGTRLHLHVEHAVGGATAGDGHGGVNAVIDGLHAGLCGE